MRRAGKETSGPAEDTLTIGGVFCGSVQANIEYLYIRSYGQAASVTSNLRVYSLT